MTEQAKRPRFSIVSAVYDVEPYLPAFIDSIERLRIAPGDLEIIAVDDGSTDASLHVLHEWRGRSRYRVEVHAKPNGGQGSARNLGLDHATGEWVTFTDPDDMLDRDFFGVVARFADAHPTIEVLSARPILLLEDRGRLHDGHPRRRQYTGGNRVVDLRDEPSVFLGVSSGSLFRLDRIRDLGLRFDPRIRPNFEDAQFAIRFLLDLRAPTIGLLRDAVYIYRKRRAGTSTLQGSPSHPGRYAEVLELGYLDAMERGRQPDGSVAPWIQHLIVYELTWYLSEDDKISSRTRVAPDALPRFHDLLGQILRQLDPAMVAAHRVRNLASPWVDILSHSGRAQRWHGTYAVQTRTDAIGGLQRVQYRFVGTMPEEAFELDGVAVRPAYAKTQTHRYYGADLLFERILWLPAGDGLRLRLDGTAVPIVPRWPRHRAYPKPRGWRARLLAGRASTPRRLFALARRVPGAVRRRIVGRTLRAMASLPPWRTRFAGAWLLMDRIHNADDNGERLFEHLRRDRPDINAWFVLERGTPDWQRLVAGGERRLLAHGSITWRLAMLNCSWLLSSHADRPIVRPQQLAHTGRPRRRFAFLQHGVIKDDLSRWLNQRDLDLFVVSTEPELASIADDGTPYRFTHRETRNTGLPRFDRLLAVGDSVPPAERDLVLVAPTWRQWLTLPLPRDSQRRAIDAGFWDSEYFKAWSAVLRSTSIADAVARRGWRVGFMPHPNLQGILRELELPAHVEPLAFTGTDVQTLYGRCALLITDYSSVAFNTAYLGRPTVYFQFDREAMFRGAHVGRQGYFDYERDGFGPVVEDASAAERAIVAAIEHGPSPAPDYLARINTTFPSRDGRASARVVAAIEELSRPYGAPTT